MSLPYAEVIGDPIDQSKSPAIHHFWLAKLGLAADYRAAEVTVAELPAFLSTRRAAADWRGCNVTMPLKQAVLPLLDRVEPAAARIGAVNTVVREADGTLSGANTDAAGFLEPLRPLLAERHWFRMARVLGTGGAARAVAHALAEEGFTLVVAGRSISKAQTLLHGIAARGEHHAIALDHFAAPTNFAFDDRDGCLDLVVNTTPLGMAGQPPLLIDLSHAPPGSIVYDIVTDPVRTALLQAAEVAGLRALDGLHMLVGQAALAFERFFHQPAPRQHDAELRTLLGA